MKNPWFKQLGATVLLLIGLYCSGRAVLRLTTEPLDPAERLEVWLAFGLFGVVPMAGGVRLAVRAQQQAQQAERDRLQVIFFDLVTQRQGCLSVLDFAIAAQISGTTARHHLDQWAREFNATFDVSDLGGISYCFHLDLPTPLLPHTETYDVVIQAIPHDRTRQVLKVLQTLTGLGGREVAPWLQTLPVTVWHGVERSVAELCRQHLEQAGAIVWVVVH